MWTIDALSTAKHSCRHSLWWRHQGQLTAQYPSGLDHVPDGRRAVLLHFKGLRLNWAVLYFLMIWWIFNIKSEQNSVTDRLRPFFFSYGLVLTFNQQRELCVNTAQLPLCSLRCQRMMWNILLVLNMRPTHQSSVHLWVLYLNASMLLQNNSLFDSNYTLAVHYLSKRTQN